MNVVHKQQLCYRITSCSLVSLHTAYESSSKVWKVGSDEEDYCSWGFLIIRSTTNYGRVPKHGITRSSAVHYGNIHSKQTVTLVCFFSDIWFLLYWYDDLPILWIGNYCKLQIVVTRQVSHLIYCCTENKKKSLNDPGQYDSSIFFENCVLQFLEVLHNWDSSVKGRLSLGNIRRQSQNVSSCSPIMFFFAPLVNYVD